MADRCIPVDVDGETVIVRTGTDGPLSDEARQALAALVRAAREQFGADHPDEWIAIGCPLFGCDWATYAPAGSPTAHQIRQVMHMRREHSMREVSNELQRTRAERDAVAAEVERLRESRVERLHGHRTGYEITPAGYAALAAADDGEVGADA